MQIVFVMMEMGTKGKKGEGQGGKRVGDGEAEEKRAWGYHKASTCTCTGN